VFKAFDLFLGTLSQSAPQLSEVSTFALGAGKVLAGLAGAAGGIGDSAADAFRISMPSC